MRPSPRLLLDDRETGSYSNICMWVSEWVCVRFCEFENILRSHAMRSLRFSFGPIRSIISTSRLVFCIANSFISISYWLFHTINSAILWCFGLASVSFVRWLFWSPLVSHVPSPYLSEWSPSKYTHTHTHTHERAVNPDAASFMYWSQMHSRTT